METQPELKEISIDEIHSIALDIMKDIDRFCRANDISYTLSSGTLLGAVRHGGFIPWDDDADIFMLRKDFDKFVSTYKSDRYKLAYNSDPNLIELYEGFAKLFDTNTFHYDRNGIQDYGVSVDIFPIESVPEDPDECKRYMHKIMRINNRLYHRCHKDLVSIIKSYRHSFAWWLNRLDTEVHNNPYGDSPLVAHILGSQNYRTVIPRAWFDDLVDTPFEGYNFLAFRDTDSYLTKVYGPDYMTPVQWSHNIKIYRKQEEK